EAAISAGTKALREGHRELVCEGHAKFELFSDVAKAPECIGVVLLEGAERGPEGARREGDVRGIRLVAQVRVEGEIGQGRCPRSIRISTAGALVPIPHPPDGSMNVFLLHMDQDLGPVLFLKAGVAK